MVNIGQVQIPNQVFTTVVCAIITDQEPVNIGNLATFLLWSLGTMLIINELVDRLTDNVKREGERSVSHRLVMWQVRDSWSKPPEKLSCSGRLV